MLSHRSGRDCLISAVVVLSGMCTNGKYLTLARKIWSDASCSSKDRSGTFEPSVAHKTGISVGSPASGVGVDSGGGSLLVLFVSEEAAACCNNESMPGTVSSSETMSFSLSSSLSVLEAVGFRPGFRRTPVAGSHSFPSRTHL